VLAHRRGLCVAISSLYIGGHYEERLLSPALKEGNEAILRRF